MASPLVAAYQAALAEESRAALATDGLEERLTDAPRSSSSDD